MQGSFHPHNTAISQRIATFILILQPSAIAWKPLRHESFLSHCMVGFRLHTFMWRPCCTYCIVPIGTLTNSYISLYSTSCVYRVLPNLPLKYTHSIEYKTSRRQVETIEDVSMYCTCNFCHFMHFACTVERWSWWTQHSFC